MKKRTAMLLIGTALATLTAASAGLAQSRGGGPAGSGGSRGGPGGGAPPHRCPPAVAFEACSGAADGDACSFSGRNGETVSGTCFALPDGGALCVPEGAPPPDSDANGGN